MNARPTRAALAALVLTFLTACHKAEVSAEEFCIQSKVFLGKEAKDVVESTTIFRAGNVYDFLNGDEEITISNPLRNRFIVLDPARRVKAEVTGDELEEFSKTIKLKALAYRNELMTFLAEPKFAEKYYESSGDLVMTSDWMSYEVKTVAPRLEGAAAQYADYSNWQTKLNMRIEPGAMPKFPRLLLNEALARHGRMPTEVQLSRYVPNSSKRHTVRAEHKMHWRLLESDHKLLEEADKYLVTFTPVSLPEYVKPRIDGTQPAESTAQAGK